MYILSFLRDSSRAGVMVDRFPMRKAAVLAILLGEMLDVSRGEGGGILEALDIVPTEEREAVET